MTRAREARDAEEDTLLRGVKVLDLTRLLPGALCTQHLADMGADVVKVEDPVHGDYARELAFGPPHAHPFSALYECTNRNKRSLALDLARPEGRAVLHDLARRADVLVEGFRPGVAGRLGADYATLAPLNPALVHCSISGYGQDGPYRDRPGHDLNYCATAGVTEQNGAAGAAPVAGNLPLADVLGGALSAATGILAALFAAQRTGRGRSIDVSMADCTLAHSVTALATLNDTGAPPARGTDTLSGGLACYGLYRCADGGWVALAALEPKFWARFCARVGRPELAARQYARGAEAERLRGELERLFATRTRGQWDALLGEAGCCFSPVLDPREALDDAHFRARELVFETPRRGGGTLTQVAFPLRMAGLRRGAPRAAPAHGEHGAEVLAELGYDARRVEALAAQGVLGPAPPGD